MSAAPTTSTRAETLNSYSNRETLIYCGKEYYTYETTKKGKPQEVNWELYTPEIFGLTISAVVIVFAILISFILGHAILATLFIGPLIGVLAGAWYIRHATATRN